MENMTIDEIKVARSNLEAEIHTAAASMELGTALRETYMKLKQLQAICPHEDGNFNYNHDSVCPICGKKINRE